VLLSCLTSDLEPRVGASVLLYTTKTCPCEYAEDFCLSRSLLPRWLCGVQDFLGTENCRWQKRTCRFSSPPKLLDRNCCCCHHAGENEEEMRRIQSTKVKVKNTTNFIVSLDFGLPCECETIWLSKSPGSCVGMRICFVSTSSIIASRIVSSQNGP
jgi:hypothetical protein